MNPAASLESLAALGLRPLLRPLWRGITRLQALRILRALEQSSPSPFATRPAEGWLRGIDVYERRELIATLQRVLGSYWKATGRFPDLVNPRLYSEKVNRAKFLAPFKVPESGNKFLTASFLPPGLEGLVSLPEIVWRGDQPTLPADDSLPPGEYFLKASHGSGMVRRIRYPLETGLRSELEATGQRWLRLPYNLDHGEWWYNVFPRGLLIEKSVSSRVPSISLLFYVLNGEVAMITVFAKSLQPGIADRRLLLDGGFQPHERQDGEERRLAEFRLGEPLQRNCLAVARAIGRQFRSVRVDLIIGDDQRVYLNEVTFTPNDGLPFVDRDLDQHLGGLWAGPGELLP